MYSPSLGETSMTEDMVPVGTLPVSAETGTGRMEWMEEGVGAGQ